MNAVTVARPRTAAARPNLARAALSRTGVEVRQFFREKDSVVFIFAFPVILLGIFGAVFDRDIAPGVSFTQYFVAGMIASGIMVSSFQSLAISITIERDDGTLKRLRGTPMPPSAYLLGKIGLVLVSTLGQLVLLLAAAVVLFGISLPSSATSWATFAWLLVLGSAAGTMLGIAFSSVPGSARSAPAVVTPIVLVLQFISGVFFVYTDLPSWMQRVAEVFPLKWMAQGMRSVFLPADFEAAEASGSWQLVTAALVLAVWAVIGLAVCARTFRWTRRDAG